MSVAPAVTSDLDVQPAIETDSTLLLPKGAETLLDTLERHGVEVEYQCRSGYCGACRTPLLAGTVRYLHPPLAFVAPGECLPCCCQAQGTIRLALGDKQ
ncbi:class I ribonucleotide reductase maintenance protein YfaE [Aeromonas diversa]|uniref:class I ribonucleotide reductase maintenance protein YfaE n=1 Tax=Aeromonas diversa TaxID=502790 RepID=UPI0039A1E93A